MEKLKIFFVFTVVAGMTLFSFTGFLGAQVDPDMVEETLPRGESLDVAKKVTAPDIPPVIDICLLQDETGSFFNDIANLQGGTTAEDIYDNIVASSSGAQFAVAGFRDYPVEPHGSLGDHVYRLHSSMSPAKANWLAGIASLSAGGGFDFPEAQYDAIVAAAGPGVFVDPTVGDQADCGWRDPIATPGVQRVLVVTTDAAFHLPGGLKPHVNTHASASAALNAQNIIVVGLKAPGAGLELDALASASGGSVQALSSDGANIAQAILDGLLELTTDVWWEAVCDPGLNVSLDPAVHFGVPGNTMVNFVETITVDNDPALEGTTVHCDVTFIANSFPDEGAPIGKEKIWIHVDTTPPEAACVETVNPHGKKVPPAGSTTLPGPKGGQNEDGFYEISATDNVDPDPDIFVRDTGSGTDFGPFPSGTKMKYTEAPGAQPISKKIGSTNAGNNGKSDAVDVHIIGNGDAEVFAVDGGGNESDHVSCLVPPPPK